ncbi:MAG: TAT-variant-translocated molybdopterin oxidoreductase, partial [Planctomycetota bacterium]
MPSVNGNNATTRWWRSVDELRDGEVRRIVEREFPSRAGLLSDPVSRRQFLKVMGASMALLTMTGCRWPDEEIVPYAHRPEGTAPGVPKRFATSMEVGGVGSPLLVTSFDGRPVKVDGNPEHPLSMGKSDAIAQASVLELYDPDRSRRPLKNGEPSTWNAFRAFAEKLQEGNGEGLRVLAEASASPSLATMQKRFHAAFPKARWVEYEPFSRAHGEVPRLDKAEVVVCLDDDILGDHPTAVRNTLDFAKGRRGEGGRMNRLHVLESTHTTTGAMADHRYPMPASDVPAAASKLMEAIRNGGEAEGFIGEIARDLLAPRGRSLVAAGLSQPREVRDLVDWMNHELGNGETV